MWKHETLKSCKIEIGSGYIELDGQGIVCSPSPYALHVLQRYGNVTGFHPIEDVEPVAQDTASEATVVADEVKPKRRRTSRKSDKT